MEVFRILFGEKQKIHFLFLGETFQAFFVKNRIDLEGELGVLPKIKAKALAIQGIFIVDGKNFFHDEYPFCGNLEFILSSALSGCSREREKKHKECLLCDK